MTSQNRNKNIPIIQPDLIFLDLEATSSEIIIAHLATYLVNHGWVKNGFVNAILDREQEYPTGLSTGNMAAAIPHTDAAFVLKSAMVVAVLKKPVIFKNMADPDEELLVRTVFLLAIKEPAFQVAWLKKLMAYLVNPRQCKKYWKLMIPKQCLIF